MDIITHMKCIDKSLLFILLAISSIGCSHKNSINIEKYICPDLKEEISVLYEFKNSNIQALPLKYLLIRRKSMNEEVYTYSYLDTTLNFIGSSTEKRTKNYTQITGISNFVLDGKGKIRETKIKIDSFQIPFNFQVGAKVNGQWQWKSNNDENLSYSQSITRKLIGKNDATPFQDSTVSTVEFNTIEETRVINKNVSDKDVIHENTTQFYSNLIFAEGLGLIKINMRFSDGTEIDLLLDKIHTGKKVDKTLSKQDARWRSTFQ